MSASQVAVEAAVNSVTVTTTSNATCYSGGCVTNTDCKSVAESTAYHPSLAKAIAVAMKSVAAHWSSSVGTAKAHVRVPSTTVT